MCKWLFHLLHNLEEVRQLAIEKRRKESKAKEDNEKAEYIKHIQDIIYAGKTLRAAGSWETTHLTDTNTHKVTHCIVKMRDWIMKAWMPLFRMYEDHHEPTWEAFRMERENELEDWREDCPEQIHEKGLEIEIKGRPQEKSGGTDGWRIAEAHLLPSMSFKAK